MNKHGQHNNQANKTTRPTHQRTNHAKTRTAPTRPTHHDSKRTTPPNPRGVPGENTPAASPHALPFAPTRPNGSWHPLRAILWGLVRAFTLNPSTFTSRRCKALRGAFIRFERLRDPRPWPPCGPPHVHRRRVRHRRPVDGGHVGMPSSRRRSNGFAASRHTPTMRSGGWFEKNPHPRPMMCRALVLAGFQRGACGRLKLGVIDYVKGLCASQQT